MILISGNFYKGILQLLVVNSYIVSLLRPLPLHAHYIFDIIHNVKIPKYANF